MKTQVISINGVQFLIGKLDPGHHEELWFRKMAGSSPAGTSAVFIAKIGKMTIEQQEEHDFNINFYKGAIKGTEAENWPLFHTYIFALISNGKGI